MHNRSAVDADDVRHGERRERGVCARLSEHALYRDGEHRAPVVQLEAYADGFLLLIPDDKVRGIPVVAIPKAVGRCFLAEFRAPLHHLRIVAVQDQCPTGRHVFGKRALLASKRFGGCKKFYMHRYFRHAGDDDDIRPKPFGDIPDVARAVGPHFEYQPFRVRCFSHGKPETTDDVLRPAQRIFPCILETKNGKRYSQVAIETFLALSHMESAGERRIYRVLRRGLSHASRDGDYLRLVPRQNKTRFQRKNEDDRLLEKIVHILFLRAYHY